jgi:hypothetical protein
VDVLKKWQVIAIWAASPFMALVLFFGAAYLMSLITHPLLLWMTRP